MSNENSAVTPNFTTCFPAVFRPKEFNGKEKYQVTMVFKGDADLSNLKSLAENVAKENFGKVKGVELPFKDGDSKDTEKYPIFADSTYIQASTQFPVGLVDQSRQPILSEDDFYAGCIARAQISAYSWSFQGRKGVSFNLKNIQKVAEGKRLGGSKSVEDIFSIVEKEDDDLGFDID